MPKPRRVIVIAKERPFDEEKWKQLLTALAYLLHERRQARDKTHATGKSESGARAPQ